METEEVLEKVYHIAIEYGMKLGLALGTLVIGIFAIRLVKRLLEDFLLKKSVETAATPYIVSLTIVLLRIMLFISVLAMMGVEMTSFIALLGAMGLGIGMALSGTLQNFAGGLLVLLYRPFKKGDFIEMAGNNGTVKRIQLFNTVLLTPDNKNVIIPNSHVSSNTLINYTAEKKRRVDLVVGISYESSIEKARAIIIKVIEKRLQIDNAPPPFIGVGQLGESSVDLAIRVWCNTKDYGVVFHGLLEEIKVAFDLEGIVIPKPQRDIHIYNHGEK